MEGSKTHSSQSDFTKLAIITVIGVIILAGAVYAAYVYSRKQTGNIVLPGGVTYLGSSPTIAQVPSTAPLRFTADATTSWNTFRGSIFPYTFSYPSTLPLIVFTNDPSDSVAIAWGNIPPQQNILLNIELIDDRDPELVKKTKIDYVRSWYKFFSGLKGVASVQAFTNLKGMKGYKAQYINYIDSTPNLDIFFEISNDKTKMIHLANGILDATIFDRIVDSLDWEVPTPTVSEVKTETEQ